MIISRYGAAIIPSVTTTVMIEKKTLPNGAARFCMLCQVDGGAGGPTKSGGGPSSSS